MEMLKGPFFRTYLCQWSQLLSVPDFASIFHFKLPVPLSTFIIIALEKSEPPEGKEHPGTQGPCEEAGSFPVATKSPSRTASPELYIWFPASPR